ncbi:MAG: tetratricopeptide repeat protein [Verrucomicrobiota bacterium]
MKRTVLFSGQVLAVFLLSVFAGIVSGEFAKPPEGLPSNPKVDSALAALADHLPGIAVKHLKEVQSSGKFSPEEKEAVAILLAEALVRSGDFARALEVLAPEPDEPDLSNRKECRKQYWRAQAYAGTGNLRRAVKLFTRLADESTALVKYQNLARLSAASLWESLGRNVEARTLLDELVGDEELATGLRHDALIALTELYLSENDAASAEARLEEARAISGPSSRADFLTGRILLLKEDWDGAAAVFDTLRNAPQDEVPEAFKHAATLLYSDCLQSMGKPDESIEILIELVEASAPDPALSLAFERLSQLGFVGKEEIDPRLSEWTTRDGDVGALASYFLGVAQMEVDNPNAAVMTFGAFIQSFPEHPLHSRALLRLSELYSGLGDKENALGTLEALAASTSDPAVKARIAFLSASAGFSAGEFEDSQKKFSASANSPAGSGPAASFNAALAALRAGDLAIFELEQEGLLGNAATAGLGAELLLERGLALADSDRSSAASLLETFLRNHPDHARGAEADLALASMYLLEFPARIVAARTRIASAREREMPLHLKEEADYIEFWLEESGEDPDAANAAGEKFIQNWPDSERTPSVRFKIGEIQFANADYPNALTQFQLIPRDYPGSALEDQANFFAGKSAMMLTTPASLEQAIELWERVARGESALALPARLLQAKVKQSQNKTEEALALYDLVLESDPPEELLFSVISAKGEMIFRTGESTPEGMAPAIEVFEKGIDHEEVPLRWRFELLYRLGKSFEKAGDLEQAINAYYSALQLPQDRAVELRPEEYSWFYRCGDAALRILEEQKNTKAAIAICDRLREVAGPRAQEAAARAEKLRLESFEWR